MMILLVGADVYGYRTRKRRAKSAHVPTIAVIIPAHNEETTIERALESLSAARYPSSLVTILVVDDGSTDRTAAAVEHFAATRDSRVRLLRQRNQGKAVALNRGIRESGATDLVMSSTPTRISIEMHWYMRHRILMIRPSPWQRTCASDLNAHFSISCSALNISSHIL